VGTGGGGLLRAPRARWDPGPSPPSQAQGSKELLQQLGRGAQDTLGWGSGWGRVVGRGHGEGEQ